MDTLTPPGRFVIPEKVITHLHLKDGDRVADLGAGAGFFLKVLSLAVGSTGRVYACDIQRPLIEKLGDFARAAGLGNVDPLWCDLEEPGGVKVADGTLDAALLVNTLFQLEDKSAAVAEIHRTLRSGGVAYVIDWTESFGGLGPQPGDVVSELDVKARFESSGFIFERAFDAGAHHYGLAFRKL